MAKDFRYLRGAGGEWSKTMSRVMSSLPILSDRTQIWILEQFPTSTSPSTKAIELSARGSDRDPTVVTTLIQPRPQLRCQG